KSIVIYIFITDSFVNEIFGDNMITLSPKDVKQRSGPLPAQRFSVMMDERAGIAESIRRCPARSTRAGDTMNWWCATGPVLRGNTGMEVAGQYGEPL
ncbi:MAG TPA: hypothetical protein VMV55_01630, partial [Methanoregula sp.]|nr:hypothetical protein [Methanoregula sp.]